ncbi:hypothetical protein BDW02DRAFT_642190 [Decorospora gaudefroyi]|uniref:Uncharacterized protein n=1 Tax=Decorospora gaudefroyi TaxID=184978 RepID=A0A6A5KAM4_9PLEO|nr:hypothetical protein BDW02DRAFT_642190 [Decorospora gaudefroyi]
MARSTVLSFNDSPNDDHLAIEVYTDSNCNDVYFASSEVVCVPNEDNEWKSYRVIDTRTKRAAGRSPQGTEGEIEARDDGAEFGLEKAGAPKKYDVSKVNNNTSLAKGQMRIPGIHPYLSASFTVGIGLMTLYTIVVGCLNVITAEPMPQSACAVSIVVEALSWMASVFTVWHAYKHRMATIANRIHELEMRPGVKARGEGEEEMERTISYEEYVEGLFKRAGVEGKHIGYHKRSENHPETPAYQFTGSDGQDFIFTMHGEPGGEIKHSISFAHSATIEDREPPAHSPKFESRQHPSYRAVRTNGGLDIQVCQRNRHADWADIRHSPEQMYDYFYDDFTCLIDPDELVDAEYISADVMDRDGDTLLTIGMSPFQGNSPYNADYKPACNNQEFYFSPTCVY